jgi:hypothetical protein
MGIYLSTIMLYEILIEAEEMSNEFKNRHYFRFC